MEQDKFLLAAVENPSKNNKLPDALQKFYDAFNGQPPQECVWSGGVGVDNLSFGELTITVDNVLVSCIYTEDYESASVKNLKYVVIQGYAQAVLFDRFYASSILIGKASTINAGDISSLTMLLAKTREERKQLEDEKIKNAQDNKINPSFFVQAMNDPVKEAKSTNGIYIIEDPSSISYETVFQAVGIADFADNTAFGLAIAVSANINTFTNAMTFTVAASIRLASNKSFTVAGEIGLLEGKLNAIGLYVKSKIPITAAVSVTQATFKVKGFQEPKIAVGFGGTIAIGTEITVPKGIGVLRKALFPNRTDFCPLELNLTGEINPMHDYYSFSGKGTLFGTISVSGAFAYDAGNIKAEVKAGLVSNSFLNGSLSATFNRKKDDHEQVSWNLRANFNCSVTVDILSFAGISVSGSVDVLLNSQDYTVANNRYNRKDLTITVAGMAKVKVLFTFNLAVQKTWVFNLSNTLLSEPDLLMRSFTAGDTSALEDVDEVLVCESKDIVENQRPPLSISSDAIATKSWQIDEQCSKSGLVRFQVAAQYTLVDSNWQLTHSNGDTITVYTSENSAGVVTVQSFAHNSYELLLDTPDAGNWTLEILGDSKNSGGIYMDALQDEKFVTELEIIEQTDSAITFRYSAFTGSVDDATVVRLFAEEISSAPGSDPYFGIIAYLEETENGEFIWEIPEEFRHNANYRFYISAASSSAGSVTESNGVEVFIARQTADLECSWELAYNADNTDTVTAYITVTNTGIDPTAFKWEILDYTNKDSVDAGEDYLSNVSDIADVLVSGSVLELEGKSSVTIEQIITITDELLDNPSSLLLSVTRTPDNTTFAPNGENDEIYADDTDEITFSAVASENCQQQTISWQAVAGAEFYILQYALEGDWEYSSVYINKIYDTSYILSVAPGEYAYRVIAMGSDGKAIGTWSEEQEFDVLFQDKQILNITGNVKSSRSQVFSLNDGIYSINGIDLQNFTGTLTLFRNDLVQKVAKNNSVTLTQTENDIITLKVVNGILKNPISEIILDHGDYFWEWTRTKNINDSSFNIELELTGEVFSVEQKDREIISIGDDTDEMPLVAGAYKEKLEGEVGFCNKDAIYQYMTDDGGELSLTIKGDTTVDAKFKIYIYVQSEKKNKFTCVKSLTVKAGEYTADSVILNNLSIKNNFYIQIVSWDNGKGKYNTDYALDLTFDVFEDNLQECDIIEVDGDPIQEWIGYRNSEHRYLLQIDSDDLYAVRLQGDAGDAVLKICTVAGKVIKKLKIQADGTAFIDNIYLESNNYFIVVESNDKGKGKNNTDYTLSVSKMQTLYPTEILSIDGPAAEDWIGFMNPDHTYRLEADADDRYCIRLTGDAQEASLKICDLQGKVIKKLQINADGKAYIDDIYLAQGNYFVIVETKDKGKGKCNTDYTLTAAKLMTLYSEVDNSNDTWKDASILEGTELATAVSDWLGVGDKTDFFKISLDQSDTANTRLSIELDEDTLQAVKDGILQFTCCDERGRSLALYEASPGFLNTKKVVYGSEVYIGVTLKKPEESVSYSFDTSLAVK